MRKLAWAIALMTLILPLGCKAAFKRGSTTPAPTPAPLCAPEDLLGGDRAALLTQYPLEVLPLYKCIQIKSCELESMKSAPQFSFGDRRLHADLHDAGRP